VEWVEVTGKTVDEATERALDQLGVAVDDAEVHVLSEPKTGLFGRVREEARVRARVRPVGARPKRERSRRGKPNRESGRRPASGSGERSNNNGGRNDEEANGSVSERTDRSSSEGEPTRRAGSRENASNGGGAGSPSVAGDGQSGAGNGSGRGEGNGATSGSGTSRSARRRRNRSRTGVSAAAGNDGPGSGENGSAPAKQPARQSSQGKATKETVEMAEGMTLEEQGEVGRAFLAGLLSEYGMEGSVETRLLDEETVEIAAMGTDLGMLVGPRGTTLSALQDLTRAVVQRQCPSRTDRILVDVAGYREKRSAALKRFSVQIAEEVVTSGQEKALEAMSPADRKSVHDAINEMAGVVTRSEGEDPNRYIVIAPAG
jgi:spoIIIJ-associated protein